MLRRLELVELALAELDAVIVEACRPWQHQIELLQTIPGVGETVAQVIVAETGADMSRFPTAHLAAWAGLAPAMHESAGRQTPAGKRHGNKWLTAMLVEAAGSVGRMHGKTIWRPSMPGPPDDAACAEPRSQSRIRSWLRPTGY
jgi:transposase